jgi:serine/threonine-protein kinase
MSGFFSTLLSLLKIAFAVALFGVLFIVSGYLGVQWALSAEEFEVPDVVGHTLAQAESVLTQRGLIVEVDEQPLADDLIPEGYVLRQNPLAGTAIKRQRSIRLTLSSGEPPRVLPMTVGNAVQEAQIRMQQKAVEVEYIARVFSDEFDRDRVIAQQPNSTELPEGAVVPARLLVSLGPPPKTYVMPDLTYRDSEEIGPWLESFGFRVQVRPSASRVAGRSEETIISHDPYPGFPVTEGDVITLRVNTSR